MSVGQPLEDLLNAPLKIHDLFGSPHSKAARVNSTKSLGENPDHDETRIRTVLKPNTGSERATVRMLAPAPTIPGSTGQYASFDRP